MTPDTSKDILHAKEIEYLHCLYIQLLNKIDECLKTMDQSLAGQEMMEGITFILHGLIIFQY